nr:probable E3 ubiquitin-protein ligase LUL4 [Ipomoea batatas]
MHRMYLNMLASSNGDRKRKAPEEGREMTHSPSPPPPGFLIPRFRREGAGAGTPPPLNLQLRLGQPGSPSQLPPPPRFPTPPPLNPQLHLYQPGASSTLQSVTPHAPLDLKYYYNEAMSDMLDEMRKRKHAWEMQKKAMEAMIANYRTQALIMAERVKALEKTNAALHVALHLQPTPPAGGGDGAASGEVVLERVCNDDGMAVPPSLHVQQLCGDND